MSREVKRIIIKLSGELFKEPDRNISFERYNIVAEQILRIFRRTGVEMAIVVGGGNIFRGRTAETVVDHTEADAMGMLATVINGIGLREAFFRHKAEDTRLMTSFHLEEFAEPYIKHKARHHLRHKRIIILAGGLGMPNFTTDSALAQFADELNCDLIFKASTVNGVYDKDPKINQDAVKFSQITYREALQKELAVMDATAFTMCMKSKIPIFVFDIKDLEKLPEAIDGDYSFGTLIHC